MIFDEDEKGRLTPLSGRTCFVAAWFPGGKEDPKLALLRLDAERAEIWLDDSSFLAGIKMLLGADPKEDYKDKVAEVGLR